MNLDNNGSICLVSHWCHNDETMLAVKKNICLGRYHTAFRIHFLIYFVSETHLFSATEIEK